jgi:glycosyltransferase involved in cell wall biosynthesis
MIVFNHFKNDARVLKEAYTLIENGYSVKVFALHSAGLEYTENWDGLEIERISINPIHQRFFKKSDSTKVNNDQLKVQVSPSTVKINSVQTEVKQNKASKSTIYTWLYKFLKSLLLAVHKPLTYYDFSKRVIDKMKGASFDIYHAHDLNTLYPAYKASKLSKGKLVYDSHELYIERNKPRTPSKFYKFISSQFEKYLIRKADAVITVGDCIANYLKDKYNVPLPTVIINAPSENKVNIGGKSLRQELNIPSNLKLAIYCGGITFNRGLEKLIESLTLMPNVYLVLMGYGKPEYLNKLKQIAINNKVDNHFSFYGPVAPTEVTAYTASADLGVAPIENVCLSYYFCAPNKIFEYLIGGIPVVASNFPELSKVVEENEIGFTFDPQDIQSITESIEKVFSNEKKYNEMKENTKLAAKKYNWENESKKLLNLYLNLA